MLLQLLDGITTRCAACWAACRSSSKKYESVGDAEAPKATSVSQQPVPRRGVSALEAARDETGRASVGAIALTLEAVLVARTGLRVSLELPVGGAVSVMGPTGVGKSQLLKTVARLLPPKEGRLALGDTSSLDLAAPTWRARVAWLSQDRPTVAGSPNDLYRLAAHFRGQSGRALGPSPAEIAADWDLEASKLDQAWYSLSGGEAQRASLAVALALKPEVLLLDEPTSACDEATALKIEATLKHSGIALLLVTHSIHQANRLCTQHLTLAAH